MSLTIAFTDSSTPGPSGPITAWSWDFGDSNTSTEENPVHTYASAGTYTVTLTITGSGTDGTAMISHSVFPTSTSESTFISVSSFSRPSFTPLRTVNFNTLATLNSAISNYQPGDLIKYNGTSGNPLVISGTSGVLFALRHLSGTSAHPVVFDFGCSHNIWDASTITPNFVRFINTSGTNNNAFDIDGCNYVRIYGGEYTTNNNGGTAIVITGPSTDVYFWDAYVYNVGGSGVGVRPSGTTYYVNNLHLRLEVNRFSMNPAYDNHADKGTGLHGVQLHGQGTMNNTEVILYAHDSLRPGEASAGKTWPEGGGCSALEPGQPSGQNNNHTYYVKAQNLLMNCTGDNPGSSGTQTGGNGFAFWGDVPMNNCQIMWAEGINLSGQVVHGSGGTWYPGSPVITVHHGRSSNTNQAYPNNSLSSATDPYDRRRGITYNDST